MTIVNRLLEHELNINSTTENSVILRKVRESGVRLFYHLVQFYTEEAALCPPTKQLITTCVEKLGQVSLSNSLITLKLLKKTNQF